MALSKKRTPGKNVAVMFHIDFSTSSPVPRLLSRLVEKLFFYRNLKKVDAIVVISEYWESYFLKRGYKNVRKIYCGFDMDNFNITEDETIEFKKKHNLDGKPILYLGNCQSTKGAVDSYRALSGLDVHFVTSGKEYVKIPALNLNLGYREYLTLLKAATVVLTMSKNNEGWNMTAHEAMLLRTPVIGSGKGGQRELLEGGGQIVCEDFKQLRKKVEFLLNDPAQRKTIGSHGFEYARAFTRERFNRSWESLVNEML